MAYTSLLFHVVFATKDRRPLIPVSVQPRLWAYMAGIAKQNQFTALAVGGIADHAHLLLALPAIFPVAKAVQLIKAGSSKWLHGDLGLEFAWQESYGAFSVSVSHREPTIRYINSQLEHHRKRDFQGEWLEILKRHGLEEYAGPAVPSGLASD